MVSNKKDTIRVLNQYLKSPESTTLKLSKGIPKERERYDGTLSQTMELVNKHPERMGVTDQQTKELKKRKQDKKK